MKQKLCDNISSFRQTPSICSKARHSGPLLQFHVWQEQSKIHLREQALSYLDAGFWTICCNSSTASLLLSFNLRLAEQSKISRAHDNDPLIGTLMYPRFRCSTLPLHVTVVLLWPLSSTRHFSIKYAFAGRFSLQPISSLSLSPLLSFPLHVAAQLRYHLLFCPFTVKRVKTLFVSVQKTDWTEIRKWGFIRASP